MEREIRKERACKIEAKVLIPLEYWLASLQHM
jgi:hypothetical protein